MWPFGRRRSADETNLDESLRQRIVLLEGEITDLVAQSVWAQLLFMQQEDCQRPISLRINSPGGEFAAGLVIVDTVRELGLPVRTHADHAAHGIATVILASGQRGGRTVGPTARISLAPIEATTEVGLAELAKSRQALVDMIVEFTGQHPDVVTQDVLTRRRFTPQESVTYGLADGVGI